MSHTAPAASRVATDSRSRVRTPRLSRLAQPASRRSTSLTETLSVGLGLTQR